MTESKTSKFALIPGVAGTVRSVVESLVKLPQMEENITHLKGVNDFLIVLNAEHREVKADLLEQLNDLNIEKNALEKEVQRLLTEKLENDAHERMMKNRVTYEQVEYKFLDSGELDEICCPRCHRTASTSRMGQATGANFFECKPCSWQSGTHVRVVKSKTYITAARKKWKTQQE